MEMIRLVVNEKSSRLLESYGDESILPYPHEMLRSDGSGIMRLLDELRSRSSEVRSIGHKYGISNPRVFGSVARQEDGRDSDIDILIDAGPRCTLLSIGGMTADLEDLFGRRVDVRTLNDLHPKMRPSVLAEAVAL